MTCQICIRDVGFDSVFSVVFEGLNNRFNNYLTCQICIRDVGFYSVVFQWCLKVKTIKPNSGLCGQGLTFLGKDIGQLFSN